MEQAILIVTWVLVGTLVVGYVLFIRWRLRVDRDKKAARLGDAEDDLRAMEARILRQASPPPPDVPAPAPAPAQPEDRTGEPAVDDRPMFEDDEPDHALPDEAAASTPTDVEDLVGASLWDDPEPERAADGRTVAAALAGISLPCDLVPLTHVEPNPQGVDRVAFVTAEAARKVATELKAELQRLGFRMSPLDDETAVAERGDDHVRVQIHRDPVAVKILDRPAFPSAPEASVVVELWIP